MFSEFVDVIRFEEIVYILNNWIRILIGWSYELNLLRVNLIGDK